MFGLWFWKHLICCHGKTLLLQNHGQKIVVNHFCYWNIIFGDSDNFLNHAESVHSLPTNFTQRDNADIARITAYKQRETAFTGSLLTYQLTRKTTSIDLLELFGQGTDQILNLVGGKTRDGPKKLLISNGIETSETETWPNLTINY